MSLIEESVPGRLKGLLPYLVLSRCHLLPYELPEESRVPLRQEGTQPHWTVALLVSALRRFESGEGAVITLPFFALSNSAVTRGRWVLAAPLHPVFTQISLL